MDAAVATQICHKLAVDDAEFETELVPHLLFPLDLKRRRANDQNRASAVAQDQFLSDQAGLDGLAEPNIISNQQIDPRHGKRPHHGIKLIIIHFNAAAKGRLKSFIIGGRNRSPSYRVEESVKELRRIKTLQTRKLRLF